MNAHSLRKYHCSSTAATKSVDRPGKITSAATANPASPDSIMGPIGKVIRYGVAGLLAVICFAAAAMTAAQAKTRIALLLGAEKYQNFKRSDITVAQNKALETALLKQGFDVVLAENPGNAAARAALADFSRKAATADFALIIATGHFATYRRQSFFLPVNARIRRATDLFARGLSVANIADIVHRAKSGALLMLTTTPDIPSTVTGVSRQPGSATTLPDNIVAVFSSSSKIPVSSMDSTSTRAMNDLINVARKSPLMLATLVDRASSGGLGRILGGLKNSNLSEDLTKLEPPKVAAPTGNKNNALALMRNRLKEAIKRAELAEARASEAEIAAKRQLAAAALEAERRVAAAKRNAEARARQDLAAAAWKAEAAKRAAEAEAKRKLKEAVETATRETEARIARTRPKPATPAATAPEIDHSTIQSLQVVEALLGPGQRRVIQSILKSRGFYQGPENSVFGEGVRVAIRKFQQQLGDRPTGYMTPGQFQRLVAGQ